MQEIQNQVLLESKRLIKAFNPFRFLFYFGITVTFALLAFHFAELLDTVTLIIIIVLATVYALVRDLIISRFSNKLMDQFYNHLAAKEPDMDLYIPVLEKNFQGYFLKKTAIYFIGNEMFMEAFNQPKSKKERQQSLQIKYGKDFSITLMYQDKAKKTQLCQGTLMGTPYRFAILNNDLIVKKISRRIKGEK
jgi:hypothetical protein